MFKSFILFSILYFYNSGVEAFAPCPFNPDLCSCSQLDPSTPLAFDTVRCNASESMPYFISPTQEKHTVSSFIISGDVRTIEPHHFTVFQSIDMLSLINTGVFPSTNQMWDDHAFSDVAISSISISNLDDVVPPPVALRNLGAQNLKVLSISYTNVPVQLDQGIFKDFSALVNLGLENVRITSVNDNAFDGLENHLTMLTLTQNGLGQFPAAISKLTNLKQLTLDNNGITQLPTQAFTNFKQLQMLSLRYNAISSAIDQGALDNLPASLQTIYLDKTSINALPKRILQNLSNLRSLSLAQNSINSVNKDDLQNVPTVSVLYLNENPINSIDINAFTYLKQASDIQLKKTSLPSIDLAVFSPVTSSGQVDLCLDNNDQLKSLTVTAADKFPSKATVYLRNTGLETIDRKIGDFINHITDVRIDISNSQHLKCDDLDWLTQISCPDRMVIDYVTCTDKNQQSLSDYLKNVSPTSKCVGKSEPAVPTTTQGAGINSAHVLLTAISLIAVRYFF